MKYSIGIAMHLASLGFPAGKSEDGYILTARVIKHYRHGGRIIEYTCRHESINPGGLYCAPGEFSAYDHWTARRQKAAVAIANGKSTSIDLPNLPEIITKARNFKHQPVTP